MPYDLIIIDSIICDSYHSAMYDENDPNRNALLGLQEISANKHADNKGKLLLVTSQTKELIEENCSNGCLPITLCCLLEACSEIDILSKVESDSIIKAASLLKWKKINFCVLTGNSLLKSKLADNGCDIYDLSEVNELYDQL